MWEYSRSFEPEGYNFVSNKGSKKENLSQCLGIGDHASRDLLTVTGSWWTFGKPIQWPESSMYHAKKKYTTLMPNFLEPQKEVWWIHVIVQLQGIRSWVLWVAGMGSHCVCFFLGCMAGMHFLFHILERNKYEKFWTNVLCKEYKPRFYLKKKEF